MPFHPQALDTSTLQKLAKNLKKSLEAPGINAPLALHQAQEVLARTLGHPDWHAAISVAKKAESSSSTSDSVRVFNVTLQDPALQQAMKDAGWDPTLVSTPIFDPFRRAQLLMALSTISMGNGLDVLMTIQHVAAVYEQEGEADMADYLKHDWLALLKEGSQASCVDAIARKLHAYNPKESFAFRLGAANMLHGGMARAWGAASQAASQEAERAGDESDYCRLSSRPVPPGNVFNFVQKREPAKARLTTSN